MSGVDRMGQTADVRWVVADSGKAAAASARWCAAVGPAVVATATGDSLAAADAIVVVTWNTHVGGGDLVRFVADLRSGVLTGNPVEHVVLLLQETHRAGEAVPALATEQRHAPLISPAPPKAGRIDVVAAAERLGMHLFYAPSMRNGTGVAAEAEDRGNAILSTLPLARPTALELPFERQRRVAVAATLQGRTSAGGEWSLRIVSAHLENRSSWHRALDSFGAGRARQAAALAAELAEPAVVLGADLNSWSAGRLEGAPRVLRAAFGDAPPAAGGTFTMGGMVRRKLDHLLFRMPASWQAEAHRVEDRYGSDHNPIIGLVRIAA